MNIESSSGNKMTTKNEYFRNPSIPNATGNGTAHYYNFEWWFFNLLYVFARIIIVYCRIKFGYSIQRSIPKNGLLHNSKNDKATNWKDPFLPLIEYKNVSFLWHRTRIELCSLEINIFGFQCHYSHSTPTILDSQPLWMLNDDNFDIFSIGFHCTKF